MCEKKKKKRAKRWIVCSWCGGSLIILRCATVPVELITHGPLTLVNTTPDPGCTMCTSSIVHASSKALPFFMSGHVCHLIVFSTHMPLLFSFLHSSTVSFWCHTWVCNSGVYIWLDGWAECRTSRLMFCIPGRLWVQVRCSDCIKSPKYGPRHCLPIKTAVSLCGETTWFLRNDKELNVCTSNRHFQHCLVVMANCAGDTGASDSQTQHQKSKGCFAEKKCKDTRLISCTVWVHNSKITTRPCTTTATG